MPTFWVNSRENFTVFDLLTFIDGMAIKSREDFHVFLQFERLEIEGIVLLMLVYVNRM